MSRRPFSALVDSLFSSGGRSSGERPRRRFRARWEPLEDRHLMASSLTIVPGAAGSGNQDANLLADGQILFADPDIGQNTLSTGALTAIAPNLDLTVQSMGQITFSNSVTDLTLQTGAGRTARFNINTISGGDIVFANPATMLATRGGHLTLIARSQLVSAGLNSAGGNITLMAGDLLEVNNTPAEVDVDAGAGQVHLRSFLVTGDARVSIDSQTRIRGLGGVDLIADQMDLVGASIDAGTATAAFATFSAGTRVDLGGADGPEMLGLLGTELQVTAGTLRIGDDDAGDITLLVPITLTGVQTLSLLTGGAIVDGTPGEQADLSGFGSLALRAASGIGAEDHLDLKGSNLAFENAGGAVNLRNVNFGSNLTINPVDGLTSSANSGSSTTIESAGLNVFADITTHGTTLLKGALKLGSGIAVKVSEGDLTLQNNGGMFLDPGSTIQADGTIEITAGGWLLIEGTLDAGVGKPTVHPGFSQTRVTVRLGRGAMLPDGLDYQGSGDGILEVAGRESTTPYIFHVSDREVSVNNLPKITFSGVNQVKIEGTRFADTFHVIPSATAFIFVTGEFVNEPGPGDALHVDIMGTTDPSLITHGHSPHYDFGNRQWVSFHRVESLTPGPIDLKVTGSTDTTVTPGETLVYRLDYANLGGLEARTVVLTENLPAGTRFNETLSSPGWNETAPETGVFKFNLDRVAAGAAGMVQFAVDVDRPADADRQSIVNTVSIAVTNGVTEGNPADNSATVTTPLAGMPLIAVGADAGAAAQVRVFRSDGVTEKFTILAYGAPFTGGVRVAAGDITGDGTADIITAPGRGAGAHIRVFDGATGRPLPGIFNDFFGLPANYYGGAFVSSGDINGDGRDDIIVTPDAGYFPIVRVFSGIDGSLLREFQAFEPNWTGGVSVAVGDVNADGRDDIVVGRSRGGTPEVRVYNGQDFSQLRSFFAYAQAFTGGVSVATGDVNGDGSEDIITGSGRGGGPQVRVFSGEDGTRLASFFALDKKFTGGVRVASADVNGDGHDDLIAGAGPGGGPQVRIFSGDGFARLSSHFAYANTFRGGITVAGAWHGADSEALRLADVATRVSDSAASVSDDDLDLIRAAAISHWEAAGLDDASLARLKDVDLELSDLAGNLLGMRRRDTVLIDRDAAGRGWFTDPSDNTASPGRVDLLTVVLHELGHELGLEHADEAVASDSLMSDRLATGLRRLPTSSLVDAVLPQR